MSIRGLNINQLLALQALLRTMSVTTAAKQCAITQAGMSIMLKKLRESFDDPLIIRNGKEMNLTSFARELLPKLDDALNKINQLVQIISPFDPYHDKRTFVISLPSFYEHMLLGKLLAYTQETKGHIRFEIKRQNFIPDAGILEKLGIDVGIRLLLENKNPSIDLQCYTLKQEPFYYCVKKGCKLDNNQLTQNQYLEADHVILRSHRTAIRGLLDDFIQAQGMKRNIIGVAASTSAALIAQQENDKIVLSGPLSIFEFMKNIFSISYYPVPFNMASWDLQLIWQQKNKDAPAIQWLVNYLMDLFKNK